MQRCHELLPGVSRTFALLIPELPDGLRDEVCCAYLICRIADTVEDVADVAVETRLQAFDALAAALSADARESHLLRFAELTAGWSLDADHRRLMEETPIVLRAFDSFPEADRRIITDCALEMIGGMRETISAGITGSRPVSMAEVGDLERYCYYVAGVVGRMLTRLYWRYVHGEAAPPPAALIEQGIEFGLGLQLTNVLKDHRADTRRGVSYMPLALADTLDVDQEQLLAGDLPPTLRRWLIAHALQWLDTALAYTLTWPPATTGIRVFCLGALFMALRTLAVVLTADQPLEPTEAPKITRQDVAEIMSRARADAADDKALRRWYDQERERLCSLLPRTQTSDARSS